MAKRTFSKFQHGTGCFSCRCCGRKARETARNSGCGDICGPCFDLAGIENEISDGYRTALDAKDEIANLIEEIESAGGSLDNWADLLSLLGTEMANSGSEVIPAETASAPEVMRAEKTAQEHARESQNATVVIPPSPSLPINVLQAERAQRMASYAILAKRMYDEAHQVVEKVINGRVSAHDGSNLGRTAADLQALAEVISLLDTAIASCK